MGLDSKLIRVPLKLTKDVNIIPEFFIHHELLESAMTVQQTPQLFISQLLNEYKNGPR